MEQNLPIITKKIWKMIRVVYFMLRKGLSKGKLLADLATLIKRGKIAGKAAFQNLMFHHHASATRRAEHEFSFAGRHKGYGGASPPFDFAAMAAALEIFSSASASPALPGFGPSPMVRQLRITDSPFPLKGESEEDNHVDEAAEEFIVKFYKDLKKQNSNNLGRS